jgi:agmatinase
MPPRDHSGYVFLDLPVDLTDRRSAGALVLPIPHEATTSYVRGTERGPSAILAASSQVEYFDEINRDEPCRRGIHTLPALDCLGAPEEVLARIERELAGLAGGDAFVLALGGEHALSIGAAAGVSRAVGEITVVQIDAHADLRDAYGGSPMSHACVARRIAERHPVVQVGVRSLSAEEDALIEEGVVTTVFARAIAAERAAGRTPGARPSWIGEVVDAVGTEKVYLTVDLDALDPSIMPAVGTPEPGGLLWWETLELVEALFLERTVVAADLVELCPIPGMVAPDFLAARLAYKIVGHALRAHPA